MTLVVYTQLWLRRVAPAGDPVAYFIINNLIQLAIMVPNKYWKWIDNQTYKKKLLIIAFPLRRVAPAGDPAAAREVHVVAGSGLHTIVMIIIIFNTSSSCSISIIIIIIIC